MLIKKRPLISESAHLRAQVVRFEWFEIELKEPNFGSVIVKFLFYRQYPNWLHTFSFGFLYKCHFPLIKRKVVCVTACTLVYTNAHVEIRG